MWFIGMALTQAGLRTIAVNTNNGIDILGVLAVVVGGMVCAVSGPFEVCWNQE